MAEDSSTLPNTRAGSPLTVPKVDTLGTESQTDGENLTRVNTSERKGGSKSPDNDVEVSEKPVDAINPDYILTGSKLLLAHTGFLLAILCVALDQTIVSTALPKIASDFQALDQLTWVVSAYFLTQAGLMLTFGQILTVATSKWVYLTCIILFEIGSLVCGVANSMNVLIFGRAFQGVGASGIFLSILTILAQITKLESRPLLFGSFGGVFALASVVGPLLGGAFTDKVSWRWCFYINLPFGAISVAAVIFFLPNNPPPPTTLYEGKTTLQKWLSMDWVGSAISLGMITSLLLPLQWGGVTRAWEDRLVIILFCVFAVLFIAFVAWEYFQGERAMMPLFLFKRRTQIGAGGAMFFMMISFLAATYYLPYFYQAKGRTAAQSGIDIIPFMLSVVLASFVSGGVVNATGHYWSMLIIGPCVAAVGAGVLFTIDEHTSSAKLIGYQIIFGAGLGLSFQLPVMAVQAEYSTEPELVPQASSLLTFFQLLGGVIGIAIAGTIFNNQLIKELGTWAAGLTQEELLGVKQNVALIFTLPVELQSGVIHAYVKGLDYTFILGVPACAMAAISGLLIKNWNFKERGAAGGAMAV